MIAPTREDLSRHFVPNFIAMPGIILAELMLYLSSVLHKTRSTPHRYSRYLKYKSYNFSHESL